MSRRYGKLSAPHLAGWIFADLLLVLFLISLNFHASPQTQATSTSSPSPTPSPTAGTQPRVLTRNYCKLKVGADLSRLQARDSGEGARLLAAINRVLAGKDPGGVLDDPKAPSESCKQLLASGQAAGVIIVYGATSDVSLAIGAATRAAKLMTAPDASTTRLRGAATIPEWDGTHGSGAIVMIAFFYSS